MSQKPTSRRRSTSSFVSDLSNINLMQVSPRTNAFNFEQRNPFTMANHASKSNFIGNSEAILPEGPRAFTVTKTGEKLLIQLDDDIGRSTTTHQFSNVTLPKILEQSSSHSLLCGTEKSNNKSSGKLTKKSKNARHIVNQRHRLTFTPRAIEKSSSTRLLVEKNLPKSKQLTIQSKTNTSSEAQTDYSLALSSILCTPQKCNSTTKTTIESRKHLSCSIFNDRIEESPQKWTHIQDKNLFQPSPLKIYTKTNGNLKKYSELRGIASALTLFTVIWWLLSTFFDLESLFGFFSSFLEHIQNWYLAKQKPKTKAELLVKFVQDLWT